LPVFTVESEPERFGYAKARFFPGKGVFVRYGDSREFLKNLARRPRPANNAVFFYLDAHWNDDLPLREELKVIFENWQKAVVMIDDFQVPGLPGYGFDHYGKGRTLCVDFLRPKCPPDVAFFFPAVAPEFESGQKRGCAILAWDDEIVGKLKSLGLLRFHSRT
jgi:hypothetical protein